MPNKQDSEKKRSVLMKIAKQPFYQFFFFYVENTNTHADVP